MSIVDWERNQIFTVDPRLFWSCWSWSDDEWNSISSDDERTSSSVRFHFDIRFWFASVCSNLRRVGDASHRCRHVRFSLILTTSMDVPLSQTCLSHLNRERRQMMKLPFEHWKRRRKKRPVSSRSKSVPVTLIDTNRTIDVQHNAEGGREKIAASPLFINKRSIHILLSKRIALMLTDGQSARASRTSRSMFTRREWFLIDSCLTALYICRCIAILVSLRFSQMYGQCWRCRDVVLLIIVIIWWETRRISLRNVSRRRSSLVECNSAAFFKARGRKEKRIRLLDSICSIRFFHRIRLIDR